MIERILEILKIRNLSPAQFADLIGVQRSGMSHLISGRNNPSLEFIQKVLKTFPEINSDWMLFGKGKMLNREISATQQMSIPEDTAVTEQVPKESIPVLKKEEIEKPAKRKWVAAEGKQIEKIVYFFRDNTFKEYFPE
jgi:transcriptional regulator with XRE-family HTH domain